MQERDNKIAQTQQRHSNGNRGRTESKRRGAKSKTKSRGWLNGDIHVFLNHSRNTRRRVMGELRETNTETCKLRGTSVVEEKQCNLY